MAPIIGPILMPLFGTIPVGLGVLAAFATPLSTWLATTLFRMAQWTLVPGVWLVDAVGGLSSVALGVPSPNVYELGVLLGGASLAFLSVGRRRTWLAAVLVALALGDAAWWWHERVSSGGLRVTFLDVGQGDAGVVELPTGDVILIDGGGFPGSNFDVGAAVVTPFLATRKVRRVALVIVSHTHPDHYGGLESVIERFRPRELWWPGIGGDGSRWQRLLERASAHGVRVRAVAAGVVRHVGGAEIRVVHPPRDGRGSVNDGSVVVAIAWEGRRVVFAGDVEAGGEKTALGQPALRRSDVVKVAHHGSRTSSTPDMVKRLAPTFAVISAGADNRYGHPEAAVVRRWASTGACVLRTDRCGAVTVWLTRTSVSAHGYASECRCAMLRSG